MPGYSKSDARVLKAFGAIIKAKRNALGISQEELADRAGLHRTYIGGIEQGRRNLSLLNILKVAKALAVKTDELFAAMQESKKCTQGHEKEF